MPLNQGEEREKIPKSESTYWYSLQIYIDFLLKIIFAINF